MFSANLLVGQSQKSPILQSFQNFLPQICKFFGPYGQAMITKSTIEFLYGCLLEQKYDGKMKAPVGALNFPQYLRIKSSVAEPYAHYVFFTELYPEEKYLESYLPIIPDFCDLINYVNDMFSFCKESRLLRMSGSISCVICLVYTISVSPMLCVWLATKLLPTCGIFKKSWPTNQRFFAMSKDFFGGIFYGSWTKTVTSSMIYQRLGQAGSKFSLHPRRWRHIPNGYVYRSVVLIVLQFYDQPPAKGYSGQSRMPMLFLSFRQKSLL